MLNDQDWILSRLMQAAQAMERLEPGDPGALNAALRQVVECAAAFLPGSAAAVFACGPDGQSLEAASRITAGAWAAAFQTATPRPDGLGQIALRERRPVMAHETPDRCLHPAWQAAGARAGICLPLLTGSEPVGALYVYLPEPRPFQPPELAVLGVLAQQAASALFQSRRMDATSRGLARKEDELNRLRHAGLLDLLAHWVGRNPTGDPANGARGYRSALWHPAFDRSQRRGASHPRPRRRFDLSAAGRGPSRLWQQRHQLGGTQPSGCLHPRPAPGALESGLLPSGCGCGDALRISRTAHWRQRPSRGSHQPGIPPGQRLQRR